MAFLEFYICYLQFKITTNMISFEILLFNLFICTKSLYNYPLGKAVRFFRVYPLKLYMCIVKFNLKKIKRNRDILLCHTVAKKKKN